MSQHTVILECPEKHLRHIDGAPWMVTTTDVSAKYFSADEVSQIDPGVSSTSSGFVDGVSWRAFAPNYRRIFVDVNVNCTRAAPSATGSATVHRKSSHTNFFTMS